MPKLESQVKCRAGVIATAVGTAPASCRVRLGGSESPSGRLMTYCVLKDLET